MTLIPVRHHKPEENVDPTLLETPVGTMIEGPYQWREFCMTHAGQILLREPERRHRAISLYEIKTALRPYRCAHCRNLLWDPDVKEDIP